ncbi:hypothetical protein DFQ27_001683, partial [Actinomortierella ambigua]
MTAMNFKYEIPLFAPDAPLILPRSISHHQDDNTSLRRFVLYPATNYILPQATQPLRALHLPVKSVTSSIRQTLKRAAESEEAGRRTRDLINKKRRNTSAIMDTIDDDVYDENSMSR